MYKNKTSLSLVSIIIILILIFIYWINIPRIYNLNETKCFILRIVNPDFDLAMKINL